MSVPCPQGVYVIPLFPLQHTRTHTWALKHTKGQTQSSVYSTGWNTQSCVNTGMKQTENED